MTTTHPSIDDVAPDPRAALWHPPALPVQRRYLSTREASLYCGFKTTGALRKALLEGRIRAVGRRGGTGTLMWERDDLDRFLRGEPIDREPSPSAADRAIVPAVPTVPAPSVAPRSEPRAEPAPSTQPKLYGPRAGDLCCKSHAVARPLAEENDGRRPPQPPSLPPRRGPGRPRKYPPLPPAASLGDSEPCGTVPVTASKGPRGRTAAMIDAPQKPKELSAREATAAALERIRMIARPHLRRG